MVIMLTGQVVLSSLPLQPLTTAQYNMVSAYEASKAVSLYMSTLFHYQLAKKTKLQKPPACPVPGPNMTASFKRECRDVVGQLVEAYLRPGRQYCL